MIVCVDLNVIPRDENEDTLEEIRKELEKAMKKLKYAKLINRFDNVGVTFWRSI